MMGGHLIGIMSKNPYKSFSEMLRREVKKLGCMGEGRCTGWRETLGIIASQRAQFLHRGLEWPVKYNNVIQLASKGHDIILCEKEGICELIQPYAWPLGVAIVNTRGFAPDYVKWLVKLAMAQDNHANVFVLSDMDASGLVMQEIALGVPRLGVDNQMLKDLNIPIDEVKETPLEDATSHLQYLERSGKYPAEFIDWLRTNRVEIDAVLAYVKADQFWNYLKQRMEKIAPNRKLSRSIFPKYNLPADFRGVLDLIKEAVAQPAINHIQDEIEGQEYDQYAPHDIVNVQSIEEDLIELGEDAIQNAPAYQPIMDALRKHVFPLLELNLGARPQNRDNEEEGSETQ